MQKSGSGKTYFAAAYLRLSRDDHDIGILPDQNGTEKTESVSIQSQRDYINRYIAQQTNMSLYDSYVDDGYSGTNFDRPEFQRMMSDVYSGKVNCIIVKDLSRLGRDYIEAGRLIQKTFPAFHVRFIAISDQYDSLSAEFNDVALILPVKNFINDSYCRDISIKVKSHQQVKREKGQFIGAFAVYGYRKDPMNRNKLMRDPYAAWIVKNIFAGKKNGMSCHAIAVCLNDWGILSPLEYKRLHGENYSTGFQTGAMGKWSAVAVKRILVNEMYTGTLVQGKEEKISYKINKSIQKPAEEWVRIADTHEKIITKEDYRLIQRLLAVEIRAQAGTKKPHVFSGLLFCGDCKKAMNRRINRYRDSERVYFICSSRNKAGQCTRHSLAEALLQQAVLTHIKLLQKIFFADSKAVHQRMAKGLQAEEIQLLTQEMKALRNEQQRYYVVKAGLYEDFQAGIISHPDYLHFKDIFEAQYDEMEKRLIRQERLRRCLLVHRKQQEDADKEEEKAAEPEALDRELLLQLIDRIEVFEGKQIKICYRFSF